MSENKEEIQRKLAEVKAQIEEAEAQIRSLQAAKYDLIWDLRMLDQEDQPLGDEWLFDGDEKFWL